MVKLIKAWYDDCEEIHRMQIEAFTALLNKYRDYETNPGAEPLQIIQKKMRCSDYYFIVSDNGNKVGAIRIIRRGNCCRVSPIFVLPGYQNKGYAQEALLCAEHIYPDVNEWHLDTIKQEEKLCRLYSKLGYIPNGAVENIKDDMTILFLEKRIEPSQ